MLRACQYARTHGLHKAVLTSSRYKNLIPSATSASDRGAPRFRPYTVPMETNEALIAKFPKQHFTGNPLDRTSDNRRRFQADQRPDDEISLVVVAGREICVRNAVASQQDLQALLLKMDDPDLQLQTEQLCMTWSSDDGSVQTSLPLYLLGQDKSGRWTFALDITEAREAFLEFLRTQCQLDVLMRDLRQLLPNLSLDAVAIAGQAAALSQWHQMHRYCSRCGAPTVPTETGLRRRCAEDPSHKLYPRTDPVVIMLVESPDGNRALLGRGKKFTPGMYTCLSGFIDQCESVEEAVRREVYEEARVQVEDVQMVGTQPWPIGRYGSCELMIGCIAKAKNYEVFVNTKEMEDVQWYDKHELVAAVKMYAEAEGSNYAETQRNCWSQLGFFIPPPFAVAHHLIRTWALKDGTWFAPKPRTSL